MTDWGFFALMSVFWVSAIAGASFIYIGATRERPWF